MLSISLVRYVLIAFAAFAIGFGIASAIGPGRTEESFFNPSLLILLVEYGSFHIAALSVAWILSLVFSRRVRSVLFLSLAIAGFLVSIYLFNPIVSQGLHVF